MTHVHEYRSQLHWQGSTAVGYDVYDRTHEMRLPPAGGEWRLSSDASFRGDRGLANPEQLLTAAVSSCQLLMFLALAARSRVDVLDYEDAAVAEMPEDETPMRITRIVLRPRILVAAGTNVERVRRLVERAHDGCYVANSLTAAITVEETIELSGAGGERR